MIELVVDCSIIEQRYIEDCEVCCRPMTVVAQADENGVPVVEVSR